MHLVKHFHNKKHLCYSDIAAFKCTLLQYCAAPLTYPDKILERRYLLGILGKPTTDLLLLRSVLTSSSRAVFSSRAPVASSTFFLSSSIFLSRSSTACNSATEMFFAWDIFDFWFVYKTDNCSKRIPEQNIFIQVRWTLHSFMSRKKLFERNANEPIKFTLS